MKLYISVDMEGMAGIVSPSQEREDTERFRQALHQQVEWIVEGIRASRQNDSVEEITISDSHGGGTHLSYDRICAMDDRISLVSGSPRPCYMMSGLDDTYDMVFLAGYHAGAGTARANMDHCFYGRVIREVRMNGIVMNESTANAALAGEYGVPVTLVIGDSGLERQLIGEGMMPWVTFVTTKESISRTAARFEPQAALHKETVKAVKSVLERGAPGSAAVRGAPGSAAERGAPGSAAERGAPGSAAERGALGSAAEREASGLQLYRVAAPCELVITFHHSAMAEGVSMMPYMKRLDARTVSVTCETVAQAQCAIIAMAMLGSCY